jgi:hypothetical protein
MRRGMGDGFRERQTNLCGDGGNGLGWRELGGWIEKGVDICMDTNDAV